MRIIDKDGRERDQEIDQGGDGKGEREIGRENVNKVSDDCIIEYSEH